MFMAFLILFDIHVYITGENSEAHDDEDLDDAFALEAENKTEKKFMSIILTNLQVNFEAWRSELPQEEEKEGEREKEALEDGGAEGEKEDDMVANLETVSILFLVHCLSLYLKCTYCVARSLADGLLQLRTVSFR